MAVEDALEPSTPIADSEVFFRRARAGLDYELDGDTLHISLSAFDDRFKRPSVDRALLLSPLGGAEFTRGDPQNSVLRLIAADVRASVFDKMDAKKRPAGSHTCDVHSAPRGDNVAHCLICLAPHSDSKHVYRRLKERLVRISDWEIRPPEYVAGHTDG